MARKIERVMLFNFPLLSGRGFLASLCEGGAKAFYFDKRRYSSGSGGTGRRTPGQSGPGSRSRPGRRCPAPAGGRAQQLGGSFEPAAAEVGEIPLAQHVLAVQLEAALAQTKMVGQLLAGRRTERSCRTSVSASRTIRPAARGQRAVSASSGRRSSSYSSRTAA